MVAHLVYVAIVTITVFLKMRDILMSKYNVAVELVMENTIQVEAGQVGQLPHLGW